MVTGQGVRADALVRQPEVPLPAVAGMFLIAGAVILLGGTLAEQDRSATAVIWGSVALAAYLALSFHPNSRHAAPHSIENASDLGRYGSHRPV